MTAPMTGEGAKPAQQKVWDAPTRLFHWLIVGLVAFSWWTAEEHMMDWHRRSGFTIVGLLVFRIWWGFAGPATARFSHFLKGPGTVFGYVPKLFSKDYKAAFGHNPLGALSVIAILLALIAQVGLGLFAMDTDGIESGPLARFVSYDTAEQMGDLHEDAFNILLILIALHIAAIAFYVVVKRINLITPMITGRRPANDDGPGIERVPLWRFLVGVVLAVAVSAWLFTL
jgi:cytochrome b